MKRNHTSRKVLQAWSQVPRTIENAIRGLKEKDLNLRGGTEGWSIRENVHHLVESNLITSNMVIAALAMNGYKFDWTWVNPSATWMRRLGYNTAPVKPALLTLHALGRHLSVLVAKPGALTRKVRLNDKPGGKRYVMTVEKLLEMEVKHAGDHLRDVRETRKRYSR